MSKYRSNCPLARSLDIVGDKWTLLVLREIVAFRRTTFKEIAQMKEGIASNILADRLEKLTKEKLVTRKQSTTNRLVYYYQPTQKAIDLLPMAQALAAWSVKYLFRKNETPAAMSL
ncbi:winged helix-turn-helix transcriptional regulator [Niabella soli]|uniref:HxlR family transcriptional regulator n=1 Tax=Niabella soli DSM 19437 TaxID=929713 RepID=W0F2X6_9BACT|nr:helix-turn-helix domain-containing protein [Niabella soli]AHF15854.1 HxlR family transcriptional regulator [Niabella soli DSM 19437]